MLSRNPPVAGGLVIYARLRSIRRCAPALSKLALAAPFSRWRKHVSLCNGHVLYFGGDVPKW